MCLLLTFYKHRLNKQLQDMLLQLKGLEDKQKNADPYPTVIRKGRNEKLNKKYQTKYKGTRDVSRAFAIWTDAEDKYLLERYKKIKSLDSLAKLHKRTPSAISIRLKEFKIDL